MVIFIPFPFFGVNEYLEGNAKNIAYLLHSIAMFIRQRKIVDKTTKDIS